MNQSQTTDIEKKSHIPASDFGAMVGEDEYISTATSGDVAKMASGDSPPLKPQNVLALQRTLGNRATLNIINRTAKKAQSIDNAVSPFAGLKMVMPKTIQRVDEDDGSGGGDEDADVDEQPAPDPEKATDLDGHDNEIAEQDAEIDETISEAQQLPGMLNGGGSSDENDGSLPDDPNVAATSAIPVNLGDDDDDNVDTFERQNTDDDIDDADLAPSPMTLNSGSNMNKISGQHNAPVKQKKGVGYGKHQLGATTIGSELAQGGAAVARGASTTVDAADATDAIKAAVSLDSSLSAVDSASDAGGEGVQGIMSSVGTFFDTPPMNVILPIVMLISRIHLAVVKYKQMKAFKAMMKSGGGNTKTAKKRSTALQGPDMVGAYGFAKTKRGFWMRVIKAAITVGQILARLITILSGGTAALISEAVGASLSLSQGVIKVGQSLKGIYKMIIGKRGKRRLEGANTIVDLAIDGNQDMLKFLVEGEVFGKAYWFTRNKKFKDEAEGDIPKERYEALEKLATKPQNIDEMKEYLKLAEKEDIIGNIKSQVVLSLKSN
jgi:hypothetical protein